SEMDVDCNRGRRASPPRGLDLASWVGGDIAHCDGRRPTRDRASVRRCDGADPGALAASLSHGAQERREAEAQIGAKAGKILIHSPSGGFTASALHKMR